MSEKERLQLENECLMKYSKAQMIQKYIDELEESSKLSELWCDSRAKIRELENQQKEFIDYINAYIELLKDKPDLVEEGQKDILEEILSKYKEIIGDK